MSPKRLDLTGHVSRRTLLGRSAALAGAGLLTARSTGLAAPAVSSFGAPAFRIQDAEKTAIVIGEADLETLRVDTWGSLLQYQAYRAIYEPLVHYHTKGVRTARCTTTPTISIFAPRRASRSPTTGRR